MCLILHVHKDNAMQVQGPYLPINIVKEYTHHVCVKFQA